MTYQHAISLFSIIYAYTDSNPMGPEIALPPSLKYSKQACLRSFIGPEVDHAFHIMHMI